MRLLPRIFEVKCVEDFVNIIIGAGICTAEFVPTLDRIVNWFKEFSTSGSSPICEHKFIDKVVRLLQVADDICAAPDLEAQADRFQANLIRAYVQVPELHDLAKAIVPTVFEKASYPLYGLGLTSRHQTKSFLPDANHLLSVEQPLIPFDYKSFEQRSEQFGAPECEDNISIDTKDDWDTMYTEAKDDGGTVETKISDEAKDGDDDLSCSDGKDSESGLDMGK